MILPYYAPKRKNSCKSSQETVVLICSEGKPYAHVKGNVLWMPGWLEDGPFSVLALYVPALRDAEAVGAIWVVLINLWNGEAHHMSIASAWKHGVQIEDFLHIEGVAVARGLPRHVTRGGNR